MRYLTSHVLSLLGYVSVGDAWTTMVSKPSFKMTIFFSKVPGEMDEWIPSPEMMRDENHPCWQDIYDDDCSMESIYAANFIASKWIKSMPCGEKIADCDMPAELQVPEAMEDGIAEVDVMDFLGLKHPPKEGPTPGEMTT